MRRVRVLRRAIAVALAVATAGAATSAMGDTPPSAWDRARDPLARARYALHVRVREVLASPDEHLPAQMRNQWLERARAWLEDAGAATSPDVRLRYDLGDVYYQLRRYERAAEVLRPAVDANPDHPATVEALSTLAFTYANLDRPQDERAIYKRYIARVLETHSRGVALLNLAEAEMRLGNLPDAIAGYKDAIALGESTPNSRSALETTTLAIWGLAVALDRAGEVGEALEEATLATKYDPGEQLIGHGPNVFFVPEYERQWYLGLAQHAHARAATSPREALRAWQRATACWTVYVSASDAADRYWALAKAHLARAKANAEKLARQVAEMDKRNPRRLPAPDEEVVP